MLVRVQYIRVFFVSVVSLVVFVQIRFDELEGSSLEATINLAVRYMSQINVTKSPVPPYQFALTDGKSEIALAVDIPSQLMSLMKRPLKGTYVSHIFLYGMYLHWNPSFSYDQMPISS